MLLRTFALVLTACAMLQAAEPRIETLADLRTARTALAARPRRLIANNDGCDALYFPQKLEPTVQNFLDLRTTNLAGSQVDTVSYCTISSGFSHFTHDTKAGALLTRQGADYGMGAGKRNITADLIRQGTDVLKAVTDFAHGHGMESFWSFRMNDTHDAAHSPGHPYLLFPQLKVDHPDWLVGDHVKRTPYGRWSSVNYALPEVRDLAFRYTEEVCHNYPVEGVELDFLRHLCFFKSVANGGKASAEEVEEMTGLIRRIRTMTETEGLKQHRPILVAVRVPDSAQFSRDCGLDVDTWMKEGLVDLLITTDYFRLNPWEQSVAMGHQHGVKVYPAITDPRVKGESRFKRASVPAYRARAAVAWAAGADGLYLFNFFDSHSPIWRVLGDPKTLAFTDKLYFVTDLDGKPNVWLADGDKQQTIPMLTPMAPARLNISKAFSTQMILAEDFAAASKAGYQASASLHLDVPALTDARSLTVTINGRPLSGATVKSGWLDCEVPTSQLRQGPNEIDFKLQTTAVPADSTWSIAYDGKGLPKRPWRNDARKEHAFMEAKDGGLLIADRGTQSGDYCYSHYAWNIAPEAETVAEARVKVISGTSFIIVSNGISGERLELSPTGISLYHHRNLHFNLDTTQDFHRYRVVMKGQDLKMFVDDKLQLNAPGALAPRTGYTANELSFGAANSPGQGEALWAEVKARAAPSEQVLQDVVVSVEYRKQ